MTVVKRIVTEMLAIPPHPHDSNPDWQRAGLCFGQGTELWFPPRGTPIPQIAKAKAICKQCPIRQKCLDYALWHGDRHGIWGGTTEMERRRMRQTTPIVRPTRRKKINVEWVDDGTDVENG